MGPEMDTCTCTADCDGPNTDASAHGTSENDDFRLKNGEFCT